MSGAAYTIPGYVHTIASLAKPAGQYGELDFDTPPGATLPTSIDPETAANLAEQLYAALPRLLELAALLERRGHSEPATSPPIIESIGTPAAPAPTEPPLPPAEPLHDAHGDDHHDE